MIFAIGIFWCLTLYFPLSLPIGDSFFLPNFPGVILALLHIYRKPDVLKVGWVVIPTLVFILANAVFADHASASLVARLKSGGQLPYTIFCCSIIGFSRAYTDAERKVLEPVILSFVSGMILVGILESNPAVRSVSDNFRNYVFSDLTLYNLDERDFGIAGRIRPKAFTPEPSHASWAILCLLILVSFWTNTTEKRIIASTLAAVAAYTFASPACVVGSILMAAITLLGNTHQKSNHNTSIFTRLVLGVLIILLAYIAYLILAARYHDYEGLKTDGSTYIRIFQAVDLAIEGLNFNSAMGVGFGGLESIWTKITLIDGETVLNLSNSAGAALLTIPLYGGLFGILLFSVLVQNLFFNTAKESRLSLILIVIFTLSQKANISNTLGWYVIFGVYGRLKVSGNAAHSLEPIRSSGLIIQKSRINSIDKPQRKCK